MSRALPSEGGVSAAVAANLFSGDLHPLLQHGQLHRAQERVRLMLVRKQLRQPLLAAWPRVP